jgi:hypothetical protein
MPYSQRQAIPKVSRLGTRFFAHPPGHAPEGEEKVTSTFTSRLSA